MGLQYPEICDLISHVAESKGRSIFSRYGESKVQGTGWPSSVFEDPVFLQVSQKNTATDTSGLTHVALITAAVMQFKKPSIQCLGGMRKRRCATPISQSFRPQKMPCKFTEASRIVTGSIADGLYKNF